MDAQIGDVELHYVEHGAGVPLIALHGGGVDHREVEAAIEVIVPQNGYRRIYPDLPGMGLSTADGLNSNEDVVTLLGEFIDYLGSGPVLLLGHSYGAYLARGVAHRRPDAVLGLALVCPLGESSGDLPEHRAVREDPRAYDELDLALRAEFDEYFVVRTPDTARRYRDHVHPGTLLGDEGALERIFTGWRLELGSIYSGPTLIVAGRHDATVGYADASELLPSYPNATLEIIEDAGHALMHEQPDALAALVGDWLSRAGREG